MAPLFQTSLPPVSDIRRRGIAAFVELYAHHLLWRFHANLQACAGATDLDTKDLLLERSRSMLGEVEQLDALYHANGVGELFRSLARQELSSPSTPHLPWPEACVLVWLCDRLALEMNSLLVDSAPASMLTLTSRLRFRHAQHAQAARGLVADLVSRENLATSIDRALALISSRLVQEDSTRWEAAETSGLLCRTRRDLSNDFARHAVEEIPHLSSTERLTTS